MNTLPDEQRQELRDRFAAVALGALLGHLPSSLAFASRTDKQSEDIAQEKVATEAYQWADAYV